MRSVNKIFCHIRISGPPVEVGVTMYVLSISSLSEVKMVLKGLRTFSLNYLLYFSLFFVNSLKVIVHFWNSCVSTNFCFVEFSCFFFIDMFWTNSMAQCTRVLKLNTVLTVRTRNFKFWMFNEESFSVLNIQNSNLVQKFILICFLFFPKKWIPFQIIHLSRTLLNLTDLSNATKEKSST